MRLRIAVFAVFATGMSLVSAQGCATSPPEVAEEDASVAEPVPTADAAKDSTAPVKPDSATTPDSAKPPVDSAVVDVAVRDAADSAPPAPDAGLTARDGEPFDRPRRSRGTRARRGSPRTRWSRGAAENVATRPRSA